MGARPWRHGTDHQPHRKNFLPPKHDEDHSFVLPAGSVPRYGTYVLRFEFHRHGRPANKIRRSSYKRNNIVRKVDSYSIFPSQCLPANMRIRFHGAARDDVYKQYRHHAAKWTVMLDFPKNAKIVETRDRKSCISIMNKRNLGEKVQEKRFNHRFVSHGCLVRFPHEPA